MKKKINTYIMLGALLITNFLNIPVEVKADERINENDVSIEAGMLNVFVDNHEDYEYIDKKIDDDIKSETGLIDKESEDILNKNGILDEDIEKFTKEEIEEIENSTLEDAVIYSTYYAINDVEELQDVPVEASEMIELSPEMVDKYMAEKYYDEQNDLREKLSQEFEKISNENTEVENIAENIGLKVYDAKADVVSYGGISANEPTMLKIIMITCKVKDKDIYQITFKFEWTEMPFYRSLDTITLSWDGAIYDACDSVYGQKVKVLHSWLENRITYPEANKTKYTCVYVSDMLKRVANATKVKEENFFIRDGHISCVTQLHEDCQTSAKPLEETEYEYESISMIFYLKKDERYTGITFYPNYLHMKKKLDYDLGNLVNVGISILSKDAVSAVYNFVSGASYKIEMSNSGPIGEYYYMLYK